jgi:peptidoglycan hydrolase CwlO-like protein
MSKELLNDLVLIRQFVEKQQQKQQQLLSEYNELKDKLHRLQAKNQELQQQLEVLESQKKILKIAKGLNNDPKAKQEAKLKVNEFIKEIDKCIALLQD